ncbi:unnamed protein product [Closterium sp. Yama58-4]|nr:unnamed protein product [Closterium sp. Yama58-4]
MSDGEQAAAASVTHEASNEGDTAGAAAETDGTLKLEWDAREGKRRPKEHEEVGSEREQGKKEGGAAREQQQQVGGKGVVGEKGAEGEEEEVAGREEGEEDEKEEAEAEVAEEAEEAEGDAVVWQAAVTESLGLGELPLKDADIKAYVRKWGYDALVRCRCVSFLFEATQGEHIYGTPEDKEKNVTPCDHEVAIKLRAEAGAANERDGSATLSTLGSTSTLDVEPTRRARQRDIRDMVDDTARARLDHLWAAAVADNDWAFHTSRSPAVQNFVDAAVAFGKQYTLPSPFRVSGVLLQKLVADTADIVRPLKESWKTTGCTLSVDGWTCMKSRGLVCVMAHNDTAPVIVKTVDSKTAKKAGEYLAGLIQRAICDVGDSNVVQVVMDNASNNRRAADILRDGFPATFFNNCAAHVLDLMLHDIGKVRAVRRVLNQVHRVVMIVKGSASAVVLFEELFSTLSLVRPGATRFGTQVIMLTRFLEVKKALKEMVISEEWESVAVARSEEGRAVRLLLLDEVFWDCATAVLRLMTPVYEVLRVVDTRALVMGQIYGLMLDATVKTNIAAEAAAKMMLKRTALLPAKDKPAFLAAIKAIIARRWDVQLHNPLHAMGWLLNPRNQYGREVKNDPEVRRGAEAVIQARGGDVAQRTLLLAQLTRFHLGEGLIGSDDARWAAQVLVASGRLTEAEWWLMYGGELQALMGMAVTVLSQPVTSSEVERYWSAIARVQRRDRNRLSAKKMMDVTEVAFARRARDAFDNKSREREKLYADLANGTLKQGSAVEPAAAEEEEVGDDDEEEGEGNEQLCTIDWDLFGNIGKRKKKVPKAAKRQRGGKAKKPTKGKRKATSVGGEEGEEEEAADSSGGEEEEDVPTKARNGSDPWDISDGFLTFAGHQSLAEARAAVEAAAPDAPVPLQPWQQCVDLLSSLDTPRVSAMAQAVYERRRDTGAAGGPADDWAQAQLQYVQQLVAASAEGSADIPLAVSEVVFHKAAAAARVQIEHHKSLAEAAMDAAGAARRAATVTEERSDALEAQIAELELLVSQLSSENEAGSGEVQAAMARVRELEEFIRQGREREARAAEAAQAAKERLAFVTRQCEILKSKVDAEKQEVAAVRERVGLLTGQLRDAVQREEAARKAAGEMAENMTRLVNTLRNEVAELKAEVAAGEARERELEAALEDGARQLRAALEAEAVVGALRADAERAEQELEGMAGRAGDLLTQVEQGRQVAEQLEAQVAEGQQLAARLADEVDRAKKAVGEGEKKQAELARDVDTLRATLARIQADDQQLAQEAQRLAQESSLLKKVLVGVVSDWSGVAGDGTADKRGEEATFRLLSADRVVLPVAEEVAMHMDPVRQAISCDRESAAAPPRGDADMNDKLVDATSQGVAKAIQFCEHQVEVEKTGVSETTSNEDGNLAGYGSGGMDGGAGSEEWEEDFMAKVDGDALMEIFKAAKALGIEPLVNLTCRRVQHMMDELAPLEQEQV